MIISQMRGALSVGFDFAFDVTIPICLVCKVDFYVNEERQSNKNLWMKVV